MFKFFRQLQKLEHLSSVKNDFTQCFVIRSCRKITNQTQNCDKEIEIVVEENSIKSKKKRRLSATKNLSLKEIQDLPRDELISMIVKLDIHNQQLKNLLQKKVEPVFEGSEVKKKLKRWVLNKSFKRHILLKFYYLGWDYQGYAIQENTSNTIEDYLFQALRKVRLIESRQTSNYHQCGRTDKGVSALEQVISIDVRSQVHPEEQLTQTGIDSEINYCSILNKALPKQIRAISWRPLATPNYSARFDCTDRTYRYFFPRGNLDLEKMNEACKYLVGTHNFRNICKLDVKNEGINHIRRLDSVEIKVASLNPDQHKEFDMFYLEVKGLSFLWHMVRRIVSILMSVGQHIEAPEIVKELLDVKTNHKPQYDLANELPLILFNCNFRDDRLEFDEDNELLNKWVVDENALSGVIKLLQHQWIKENSKSTMVYEMLKSLRREYSSSFPNHQPVKLFNGKRRIKYEKVPEVHLKSSTMENS